MSNKIFHSIAILGVGLIGGSLGLAVKAAGSVAEVRGWGRNSARLQRALDLGAVDTVTSDLAEVLHGVDCAIIATPTQHAEQLLLDTLSAAPDTTIISDVASVKANLADALQLAACAEAKKAQVVLAHPIAGSEQSGVEAASATLFNDQRVILTPLANTRPGAVDKVSALWRSVGAQLHSMDAELHDRVLGHTSHLPHVLAYALVDYLNRQPESELMFTFAGGGFRDFTRIAASDPRMWREISLANREALLDALRGYQGQLQLMVDALENSDGDTLEASFGRAKTARDAFKPGE
ncbi:MAG: prephenate dehydrogenase/arogenate dehydrogenase family protein [Pseudomonadales bacterium]|nr:MAG: prephenate dehydrogenase/arogenate dehydrogenase family protein [Pseudomonadales bacterium]